MSRKKYVNIRTLGGAIKIQQNVSSNDKQMEKHKIYSIVNLNVVQVQWWIVEFGKKNLFASIERRLFKQ